MAPKNGWPFAYSSSLSNPSTTLAFCPPRSGTQISVMMPPYSVIFTVMPLPLDSVNSFTAAPSGKVPNEVSSTFIFEELRVEDCGLEQPANKLRHATARANLDNGHADGPAGRSSIGNNPTRFIPGNGTMCERSIAMERSGT